MDNLVKRLTSGTYCQSCREAAACIQALEAALKEARIDALEDVLKLIHDDGSYYNQNLIKQIKALSPSNEGDGSAGVTSGRF